MRIHFPRSVRRIAVTTLATTLAAGVGATTVVTVPTAAFATSSTVKNSAPAELKKDLDKILSDPRLAKAHVGVQVRDTSSGANLYARGVDTAITPASNLKLLTTVAALDLLGPDHRFTTTIATSGTRQGSTVKGDLYIKGTGDPTIQDADYSAIAKKVAAAGITKVTGRLLVDDSWFDSQRFHPKWDPADAPFAYGAQVSALTVAADDLYDVGSVGITATPGAAKGDPVKVATKPKTSYVKIQNKATTGAAGSTSTLAIDRPAGTNTYVVTGSVPAGGDAVEKLRSVNDPALYAGDRLRAGLTTSGVTVAGGTAHGTLPNSGAKPVTSRKSQPLAKLLTPFLKLSNNGIAEILAKSIGRKVSGTGSWAAGTKAILQHASKLGVNTSKYAMIDGSGLGNPNKVSADGVTTLLTKVRTKPWFGTFHAALPIAGKSGDLVGGTLADRMKNTPAADNVHAKTGTLTGVTALSGYVTDPTKKRLTFSILFDDFSGDAPTDIQDAIAVRLASGKASTQKAPTIRPKRLTEWPHLV